MFSYRRKIRKGGDTALLGGGKLSSPPMVALHLVVQVEENGEPVRLSRRNNGTGPPFDYGTLEPGECACFWLGHPTEAGRPGEVLGIFASSDEDCFVLCTLLPR